MAECRRTDWHPHLAAIVSCVPPTKPRQPFDPQRHFIGCGGDSSSAHEAPCWATSDSRTTSCHCFPKG